MSERRYQNVAVLLGGRSAERDVSLVTGRECAKAARAAGYAVVEIDAGPNLMGDLEKAAPDAVFNALHGRWGEDGCVQGVLEWLGLPYTHSGVQASAIALDKARSKAMFAAAGLRCAPHVMAAPAAIAAAHVLPPPYVAKPNDDGSSVGVVIVRDGDAPPSLERLLEGATIAAPETLMVEAYVPGRELTVSVLNDRPLVVTEIVTDGWYDYDAKYKPGGSRHVLPAEIPDVVTEAALADALTAHRALGCRGLTRSDFRYDDSRPGAEGLTILELNTQPGMTPTSLSPEQAAHVGLSFDALVGALIEDASTNR